MKRCRIDGSKEADPEDFGMILKIALLNGCFGMEGNIGTAYKITESSWEKSWIKSYD